MLGLAALGLTVVMIYTLVKNALIGTQLSTQDSFTGTVELIVPITLHTPFYPEAWIKNLSHLKTLGGHLRIHILIDGHHPAVNDWQEFHHNIPFVEVHSFLLKPSQREAVPWMIEQIAPQIKGQVVILGDAELVPTEHAFISIGNLVLEKQKSFFVLPQTHKENLIGEALACLSPTLALTSVFGFRRIRRNISHPLLSISQGYMGMTLEHFRALEWSKINIPSWKEAISKTWDIENKNYSLAFGEKHLLRYYPPSFKSHVKQVQIYWEDLWARGEKAGLSLYLASLFIWSFPFLCALSHPFWSLASFMLLILYRFFTKIVFQESWIAMALHPLACFVWLGTFLNWSFSTIKTKYIARRHA